MGITEKDCPKQICQYFHTLRVLKRDAMIRKKFFFLFQYLVSVCFSSTVTIHTYEPGHLRIILNFLPLMLSERTVMLCYSSALPAHCNKTVNATYQDQNMLKCSEIPMAHLEEGKCQEAEFGAVA